MHTYFYYPLFHDKRYFRFFANSNYFQFDLIYKKEYQHLRYTNIIYKTMPRLYLFYTRKSGNYCAMMCILGFSTVFFYLS